MTGLSSTNSTLGPTKPERAIAALPVLRRALVRGAPGIVNGPVVTTQGPGDVPTVSVLSLDGVDRILK